MKKILCFLITLCCITHTYAAFAANNEISVYIDENRIEFDQPPVIIDGRTLVPMRALFEALGADVEWDAEHNVAIGHSLGVYVRIGIGEATMHRNTIEVPIDAPAQIIEGRTMIPLRVVSEAFGMEVFWDEWAKIIILSPLNNIGRLTWNTNSYYYGEIEDNHACGYGCLYNAETNEIIQCGLFDSSQSNYMIEGTDWYSDGIITYGTISPDTGKLYGNAIVSYSDGSTYFGNVQDGVRSGYGVFNYTDGSYYDGYWSNNLRNGEGTWYNAYYGALYTGNWVDGDMDGQFTVYDCAQDISMQCWYNRGKPTDVQSYNYSKYLEELTALYEEYEKAYKTYQEEMDELIDYCYNGDPYETEWGKKILKKYSNMAETAGKSSIASRAGANGGNIDSSAIAHAERIEAEYMSAAYAEISEYNSAYIDNWQKSIENKYHTTLARLDATVERLKIAYGITD